MSLYDWFCKEQYIYIYIYIFFWIGFENHTYFLKINVKITYSKDKYQFDKLS